MKYPDQLVPGQLVPILVISHPGMQVIWYQTFFLYCRQMSSLLLDLIAKSKTM